MADTIPGSELLARSRLRRPSRRLRAGGPRRRLAVHRRNRHPAL